MGKFALLLLLAPVAGFAQSAASPTVRYQYGDNPAWVDPGFDDSSWPQASSGVWTPPKSGGFVWVRIHMAWPAAASAPLALRETQFELAPAAEEIYLNGVQLGSNGALPPHAQLWTAPPHLVFPIPEATFPSSHQAVIAVRTWINPTVLSLDEFTSTFTVADTDTQRALAREARYSPVLGQLPFAIVGVLLVLLGFALLTVGLALRRRELLLFGIILIAGPLQAVLYELTDARALPLPMWLYAPLMSALLCIVPVSYVEFIWYAFRLGGQRWKLALQALSIFSALALLPMMLSSRLELSEAFDRISAGAGMLRDVLEASAAAWAMRTRSSQRWLAFAVFLTPGASFFALMAGYFAPPRWSGVADNLFNDSEVAGALLITAILVTRAWQAWRAGDELRIEFEAAAEVQQQLVSPAVDLPGFQIRSIYLPARQVGGDFFRVLPQADGGVLVVMGDVSGKGLKAAMTVSAIMGALPGCHSRRPSDVLAHLNEAVYGRISGFVTCCAVHISIDGAMTIANAGNPAPYRNGQEMVVESGLPLGMLANVSYPQTSDQLAGGDRLTFVSDGVIEATSASGELYGFDRTEAISAEDADQIAHAAQAFGQDDDITVLTLARLDATGRL